jgi:hypothetical protein
MKYDPKLFKRPQKTAINALKKSATDKSEPSAGNQLGVGIGTASAPPTGKNKTDESSRHFPVLKRVADRGSFPDRSRDPRYDQFLDKEKYSKSQR